MMGQSNFSNTHTNSNEPVFSSNDQPPATPPIATNAPTTPDAFGATAQTPTKPASKNLAFRTIIIALIAALVGAGATAGIMLLTRKDTSEENEDDGIEIQYASPENDGTKEIEETLKEYDEAIAKADNEEDKLGLTLEKAGYYTFNEQYDLALSTLKAINVESLDDYGQYMVYNHYITLYKDQGDTDQAATYQKLSDDALSRSLGSLKNE